MVLSVLRFWGRRAADPAPAGDADAQPDAARTGRPAGRWLSRLADVLDLARRERDGLSVVLVAVLLLVWLPEWTESRRLRASEAWWEALPEQTMRWVDSLSREYRLPDTLFVFDPNTLSADQWMSLGLGAALAARIERYVGAGGRFREPEDLLRIYGFPEEEYERLAPWMALAPEPPRGQRAYGERYGRYGSSQDGEERSPPSRYAGDAHAERAAAAAPYQGPPVDIATAGQEELARLPGMSRSLAGRAVRYRDKLGGFHAVEQLGEVWGLDSAALAALLPHVHCSVQPLRRLRLNQSPEDSLKAHPYIPPWVAAQIVAYREKHAGFLQLDELRRLRSVKDSTYHQVLPYLELGAYP
jgi:competence protein ComEA